MVRAEGDAYADLACPSADGVGCDAVDPDCGEEESDNPHRAGDRRRDPLRNEADCRHVAETHRLDEGQVRIQTAQERANLRDHAPIVVGPGQQRDAREETLGERHVDVRFDHTGQPDQTRVGRHADDRQAARLSITLHDHLLAEWILSGPILRRQSLVDDRDRQRCSRIGVGEVPAACQRQFQRLEETWLNDIPVRVEKLTTRWSFSWQLDPAQAHASAVERQIDRQRRAFNARQHLHALEKLAHERPHGLGRVARQRQVELHDVDTSLVEAGRDRRGVLERAQEQARDDDEHQGHRHLSDHERVAQTQP